MRRPSPNIRLGDWILHYRIDDRLGAGGMGVVFKAWDRKLERTVALKVLHSQGTVDEDRRRRFLREARSASALSHPGIVSIYEINEHDGTDILVMEFVPGHTLAQILQTRRLHIVKTLQYAVQIAEALSKAHAAGIVHRDLKPGNIMITQDDCIKILDFGLAKHEPVQVPDMTESLPLTQAGQILGTPSYMSPEQALGKPVDHRSDIFSFGVIVYEMLSGAKPFEGATPFTILHKITSEEPVPVVNLSSTVPGSVSKIVHRMMAKHRDDRTSEMSEAVGVLRVAMAEVQSEGDPSTLDEVATRPALAKPWLGKRILGTRLARGIWGILGAGTLALGFMFWPDLPRRSERSREVSSPQDGFSLYQNGSELLAKKYRKDFLDRAIDALEKATATSPNHAASYASLAEAYVARYQSASDVQWLQRAREAATRSVELNPELAAAHTAAGMTAVAEGAFSDATTFLERALNLNPGNARAHQWLGRLYDRQGKADEAAREYKTAMDLDPNDWEPASALGTLEYDRQRYKEATKAWEKACELSPDNPLAYRNVAIGYHMMDRYEDSAASLQKALTIEPSAVTYNNLGTLRFFQGYYRDAVKSLEKAVAMNANRYTYWGNLGDAYRWAPGERTNSFDAYKTAVRLGEANVGKDKHARSRIALYLAKSGDLEGASKRLSEIPDKEQDATMRYRAAVVHELAGRRDKALEQLQAAIKGGYALREITNDPELIALRNDVRYHRLALPSK